MKNLEHILNEKIIDVSSIGGGCIADAKRVTTASDHKYFVKSYAGTDSIILKNEANGLIEIEKAKSIRVPHVVHFDDDVLILEFISPGRRKKDFSQIFGRQFAQMHRLESGKFGFYENNFIGANPQINLPLKDNWIDFYWEHRLLYQFQLAEKNGYVNNGFRTLFGKLESRLPEILSGSEEKPCILHGDLWSGNYMVDETGSPVLIDPAAYYGHREADLGMTRLFGGFDDDFYRTYNEAYPLPAGWEYRIDIYKLYHVLNHLNLFGQGYFAQSVSLIKKYL